MTERKLILSIYETRTGDDMKLDIEGGAELSQILWIASSLLMNTLAHVPDADKPKVMAQFKSNMAAHQQANTGGFIDKADLN